MMIKNSKGEDCVLSYTPLETMTTWFLLAYIPADDLMTSRSIDWLLLGIASLGFLLLLIFNSIVLMMYNRELSEAARQANQANEAKSSFLWIIKLVEGLPSILRGKLEGLFQKQGNLLRV